MKSQPKASSTGPKTFTSKPATGTNKITSAVGNTIKKSVGVVDTEAVN